jgi:TusA-related sulfurtransferase
MPVKAGKGCARWPARSWIVATDRGALADIPAWAEDTGCELLETKDEGSRFVFLVRKGVE